MIHCELCLRGIVAGTVSWVRGNGIPQGVFVCESCRVAVWNGERVKVESILAPEEA